MPFVTFVSNRVGDVRTASDINTPLSALSVASALIDRNNLREEGMDVRNFGLAPAGELAAAVALETRDSITSPVFVTRIQTTAGLPNITIPANEYLEVVGMVDFPTEPTALPGPPDQRFGIPVAVARRTAHIQLVQDFGAGYVAMAGTERSENLRSASSLGGTHATLCTMSMAVLPGTYRFAVQVRQSGGVAPNDFVFAGSSSLYVVRHRRLEVIT